MRDEYCWWQSTCIVHGGYRVEYEVCNDSKGGMRYTGWHRYVAND